MVINQKVSRAIDIAAYVLLLINTVSVPLFLDGNLNNFYIIPKQYVFICLLLLNVVLFVAKLILSKSLSFRRSIMDLPVLGLLLASFFSALFSANRYDSFLGRGEYFVFNLIFLIFLVVFYFLITNFINTRNRWNGMLDTLVYTGGFTALLFLIKSIFKFDLLGNFFPGALNVIERINTPFGIWLTVVFILSAGLLLKRNIGFGRSISYFTVALFSLVSLVLLSFTVLWWVVLIGLIALLLVGVSLIKQVRVGWVSALFAALVLTVVFIAFGTPRYMQASVPAEISLGVRPSWSITAMTMFDNAKNFIIGSGQGTFNVDFSQHRPVEFNSDSLAWSLRFSQPFSSAMALLAENGVLTAILFLFVFIYAIGHIFNIWFKKSMFSVHKSADLDEQGDSRVDVFVVAAALFVLTISMALVFFGTVLWWFWWLLLGLLITGLSFSNREIIKLETWEMEDTPQYSLIFSFIMIVVLAGLIMVGVWGVRLYMAEYAYAKAINSSDYTSAEANLQQAIYRRSGSDTYHVALAQVYLMQASKLANEGSSDVTAISNYVAQAVNEARSATGISPRSVSLWENLSVMYENAAVIVPEARDWAIKSWLEAKKLEPTNPVIVWRLANNYVLANNMEDALKNYQEAIDLKSDYIDPYLGMAAVYESQNKLDDAIESYKKAFNFGGNSDAGVLFDFGRALYNRNKENDRKDAETLWLNAVRLQPNYSNALYSLGLLYESRGDKTTALQYYYKVKDLNPDNTDVANKIRSLVGAPKVNSEDND